MRWRGAECEMHWCVRACTRHKAASAAGERVCLRRFELTCAARASPWARMLLTPPHPLTLVFTCHDRVLVR